MSSYCPQTSPETLPAGVSGDASAPTEPPRRYAADEAYEACAGDDPADNAPEEENPDDLDTDDPAEAAYFEGGAAIDPAEQLSWYERAAALGHANAAWRCGLMYERGEGTAPDGERALCYYRQAAEAGHAVSQMWCGDAYLKGEAVSRNVGEALRWYRMGAEAGDSLSAYMCARIYGGCEGTAADYDEAYRWIAMCRGSEEYGSDPGFRLLVDDLSEEVQGRDLDDRMAENPLGAAIHKMAASLSEASTAPFPLEDAERRQAGGRYIEQGTEAARQGQYDKAAQYYAQGAELGCADAMTLLAKLYSDRRSGLRNPELAAAWREKALAAGSPEARYQLGLICEETDSETVDELFDAPRVTRECFLAAAEQGHREAMRKCAKMCADPLLGLMSDESEALMWYERLASLGDAEGAYECARRYREGAGCEKNLERAYELAELAAEQEHVDAMFLSGVMALRGEGTKRDADQAFSRFRQAAARGHVGAMYNAGLLLSGGYGVVGGLDAAVFWLEKAAAHGHDKAEDLLARVRRFLGED